MPIEIIVPSQTSAVNKLNESIEVENTFQSLDRKRINNTDDNKTITNKKTKRHIFTIAGLGKWSKLGEKGCRRSFEGPIPTRVEVSPISQRQHRK